MYYRRIGEASARGGERGELSYSRVAVLGQIWL